MLNLLSFTYFLNLQDEVNQPTQLKYYFLEGIQQKDKPPLRDLLS